MPLRINVPGPTAILATRNFVPPPLEIPDPAELMLIGFTTDGVDVSFQNFFEDIPTDVAGTVIPHDLVFGGAVAFIEGEVRVLSEDTAGVGVNFGDSLIQPYSGPTNYHIGKPIRFQRSYGLLLDPMFDKSLQIYFPYTVVRSADPVSLSSRGAFYRVTWRALPFTYVNSSGSLSSILYRRVTIDTGAVYAA